MLCVIFIMWSYLSAWRSGMLVDTKSRKFCRRLHFLTELSMRGRDDGCHLWTTGPVLLLRASLGHVFSHHCDLWCLRCRNHCHDHHALLSLMLSPLPAPADCCISPLFVAKSLLPLTTAIPPHPCRPPPVLKFNKQPSSPVAVDQVNTHTPSHCCLSPIPLSFAFASSVLCHLPLPLPASRKVWHNATYHHNNNNSGGIMSSTVPYFHPHERMEKVRGWKKCLTTQYIFQ